VFLLPWVVITARRDLRKAFGLGACALGAMAIVIAPWTVYNLTRFNQPVLVSTNFGYTLQAGNCDAAYRGEALGFWSLQCTRVPDLAGDASDRDKQYRDHAIDYLKGHLSEMPWVVVTREGRTFGFFRPGQQMRYDRFETTREVEASTVGLILFYVLAVASFFGIAILQERGTPVWPLISLILIVMITVAITFGQTRYRVPAEVSFALLAAVAIDALLPRRPSTSAPRTGTSRGDAADLEPVA
jgi:hypothetical protein